MAMWWRYTICCLLWLAPGCSGAGDLEQELYEDAKRSQYMTWIDGSGEALEEFLHHQGTTPVAPYMLVLFHVGTCHICKEALPKLQEIAKAWRKAKEPITVGHVEVTGNQEYWKKQLSFTGFPNMVLWHRPEADLAKKAKPLLDFVKVVSDTRDARVMVTKNESELVSACRKAGMAVEKDHLRKEGLGQSATAFKIELQDLTAKLEVDGKKPTWYPLEAISYEDGTPLMLFQRPDAAMHYRPHSWAKEAMQNFAQRMMQPAVTDLKNSAQLSKEMKDEKLAAIVLCAASVDESPGFSAFAKTWQDKHRSYLASSPEACPISGGARPQVLVYSPGHHQWSASRVGAPAAAVVGGPDIAGKDGTALSAWFETHRFPGIWNITYENFHLLINAGRSTTGIALDMTKRTEMGKIEKIIRNVAKPVASKAKGEPDVWPSGEDITYWGIIDGFLNGLDQFGILKSQLPRVVVFEPDKRWVEDDEELTVWNLEADLQKVPSMIRYGGDAARAFVTSRLYKPWMKIDRVAAQSMGLPGRVGVICLICMSLFLLARKICGSLIWLLKSISDSDEPTKKD